MSARTRALPLRDDLVGQAPYGAPQLDVAAPLNVNENPYPPSEALIADTAEAVARATRSLNRYPDRDASQLRADLARYLERDGGVPLDPSRVWAANGSNEIMHQLMLAFGGPGRKALGFSPTYSMYPEYCRDTFTDYVTVPRRSDFTVDIDAALAGIAEHQPALILVASPNNPTGTAIALDDLRRLAEAAPGVVVVDEAYAEFRRPGTPSALTLLDEFPHLIVTRTMSKAFALAGARLGYMAASPEAVDAVQLVRLPYHLSAVTQAVARTALAHADELLAAVAELRAERDRTVAWLRARGHEVADSDANFAYFGRFDDRHAVFAGLLERGVLIRETGPDGWLRVSIGTAAEMELFRRALCDVVPGDAAPA